MVTKEQILEALHDVEDPDVHRSIVELDMVRKVDIDGTHIHVEILLTIKACPLHAMIEKSVRERLVQLDGVLTVDVTVDHMTDEQRAKFAEKVRGRPAKANPALLEPDQKVMFIAVASGKGGVGKSTVTANLGVALGRRGLRVGIVDADIHGFSIPGIFGIKDRKPTVVDDMIFPIEVGNVKVISMQFFAPPNSPVIWRGPMLGKMLRNFFSEVYWGDLDIVLLDLPPGTGDIALDVHQMLPKSKELLVTTPQETAADVAVRAGLMAQRTAHEILGVVENMAYFECPESGRRSYLFGRDGGDRVAHDLNTRVVARIPLAEMDGEASPLFAAETLQGRGYDELAAFIQKIVERDLAGVQ